MMVVMFLLGFLFTVFGGVFLYYMQATQVNSDHAQAAIQFAYFKSEFKVDESSLYKHPFLDDYLNKSILPFG